MIHGIEVDAQSRCVHYRSPVDIIAIRMKCCLAYYACIACHEALANHPPDVWRKDQTASPAVICGSCRNEMTIRQYLACMNRCPNCRAQFNPRCSDHYHLYFEMT